MAQYIQHNPAFAGAQAFQERQGREMQLDMDQLQYDEARRTADAERAVDEALRGLVNRRGSQNAQPGTAPMPGTPVAPQGFQQPVMPQPPAAPRAAPTSPTGVPQTLAPQAPAAVPAAAPQRAGGALYDIGLPASKPSLQEEAAYALAKVPGGGKAAFDALSSAPTDRARQKERMEDMNAVLEAMKAGNPEIARQYAQMAGITFPDEFWADKAAVAAVGEAKDWQDRFYKDDPEGFYQFFQAAMKGAAANGGKPDYFAALQQVPPDIERAREWGQVGKSNSQDRPADLQIVDALRQEFPNKKTYELLQMISQIKSNPDPAETARILFKAMQEEKKAYTGYEDMSVDEMWAEAQRMAGPMSKSAMGMGAGDAGDGTPSPSDQGTGGGTTVELNGKTYVNRGGQWFEE